mmetsp:Transcript_16456/g.33225  ORF Transcript_16456/g.33225 Transcript_16456/m.33225 type:complete len:117 (+) Transcript_16456:127-477(+)|eukprot:CAMPEP_0119072256 /NCGR_PEP_ID=MMETSP1178-20130426/58251_1 /TAXON_ID=33656 /ORGANISM="unid sp, Strain CCMP2000" /LENGTH=116 /DNA_ID=CAMNT_0007054249 /DNA_START=127 /DNA_END=477 /DNA_ORIENTATION=-
MEAALQTVERYCPTELTAYVDCVDSNPGTWHATCNELKQLLSVCAAKHSPVNVVKERCKPQIEQYERCLKANASSPDTCTVQLNKLFECSNVQQGAEPHVGLTAHPAGYSRDQHGV